MHEAGVASAEGIGSMEDCQRGGRSTRSRRRRGLSWAPATRRGTTQAYGRWLTFLGCERPALLQLPLLGQIMPKRSARISPTWSVSTRLAPCGIASLYS